MLLHTIRGLFELLKHNVVTNIGGMYLQRDETRDMLMKQHRALFEAIIERRAEEARRFRTSTSITCRRCWRKGSWKRAAWSVRSAGRGYEVAGLKGRSG